jgi:cytoskeleton protein RodZ
VFEIGSSLREARLRQGVDLVEAEAATKIRSKYLHALEDEQFEVLPAQTYVKGFLRAYADYLGLDGQLYVDEFNSRYAAGEEEPAPAARSSTQRRVRRVESRPVLFALLVIAAATALVILAWRSGDPNDTQAPVPKVPQAARERERPAARPVRKRRRPPAPTRVNLVLTAREGGSWILVRVGSETGRELYQGTLEEGQIQRFRAKKLWLNVGRPGSLTWRLNGKERRAPGTDVGLFVATPRGIAPAPAAG